MSTILTGMVTAALLASTPLAMPGDGLIQVQMMGGQGYGPGYGMMGGPWWDEEWDAEVEERVEGRIAFLATEIGIKPEQSDAWNAFADVLRADADQAKARRESMRDLMQSDGAAMTAPDRLGFMITMMKTRLDTLEAMAAAVDKLYAALGDDQKQVADRLLIGRMGMGMGFGGGGPGMMWR